MNINLDDYKYRGLSGVSNINFGRFYFDVLRSDPSNGKFVVGSDLPSMGDIRKAGVSSIVGGAVAKIVGVGWFKGTGGAILLKDCPIRAIAIGEYDAWAKIKYFFALPKGKYGRVTIFPIIKGHFRGKQVVNVEVRYDGRGMPGLTKIATDQNLLTEILELFKTWFILLYKEYKPGIIIAFEEREGQQFGVIETGVGRRSGGVEKVEEKSGVKYSHVAIKLFEIAKKLAVYISEACISMNDS